MVLLSLRHNITNHHVEVSLQVHQKVHKSQAAGGDSRVNSELPRNGCNWKSFKVGFGSNKSQLSARVRVRAKKKRATPSPGRSMLNMWKLAPHYHRDERRASDMLGWSSDFLLFSRKYCTLCYSRARERQCVVHK